MNLRQVVMGAALLGAAWLAFFADKSSDVAEVAPAVDARARATPSAATGESMAAAAPTNPPPTKPDDLARTGGSTAGGAVGGVAAARVTILPLRERPPYEPRRGDAELPERRVFGASSWDPPPPKVVAAPVQPEQAPPLPYTYIGKKLEDGVWEVYLALGDDVRVVRPHSQLDAKYRVDAIQPPTLSLTYLPLKQVQTLNIGTAE
jgi:hypothetical protein